MRVVARLDPIALESELLERIDAAQPTDEPGATLVLVPTRRLVTHLQRRLLQVRPAWLGLSILDLSAVAPEILRHERREPLHVASALLLAALLERLVRERPQNVWSGFARRRPGALRRLQHTFNDLREAGVLPEVVTECCAGDERGPGLAELFTAYHRALERSVHAGWTDRAGVIRRATPLARSFGRRARRAFVYGAYELIGVNLELLREIDRGTDLTVFCPAAFDRPVSRFAETFAREYLLGGGEGEGVGPEGGGQRQFDFADESAENRHRGATGPLPLDALFDEQSRPTPARPDRITCFHAHGAAAEVKLAVRRALAAIASGCAPEEIAIVARSLAPYAAALEEAFEDEGLPWTSSLGAPLRRRPLVRDFLLLLRVVEEEFPRKATVQLLGSPRLDRRALAPAGSTPPSAERLDAWSRDAKLIGGLEDWTVELPRWAAEPRTQRGQGRNRQREARRLADEQAAEVDVVAACVTALDGAVTTAARSWSRHAEGLRALLSTYFSCTETPDDAESREALDGLFDDMARLELLVGSEDPVEFAAMRQWLEQAVDATASRLHPSERGGIRVLDAMQLRGMTFRHVHLLGMNSGLFPRSPREDPLLDDRARTAISERTGLPIGRKQRAADEERLLLALLLGSARDAVHVSWQRSNESGKAATPSLALREVARLLLGKPDLDALQEHARHLPSHPTHALEALLDSPGILAPADAMLLDVLSRRGPERTDDLRIRYPSLGPGLEMLEATQSWVSRNPAFDAQVGRLEPEPWMSVSSFETLGSCPLRHFFESVLRVEEPEDEADPLAISSRDRGSGVHELLERIYGTLAAEGRFEPERSETLVERGLELIEDNRDLVLGALGRRLSRRLPLLWGESARVWLAAVRRTVSGDLARNEREGLEPLGFEEVCRRRMELGENVAVKLSARFDRRLKGPAGVVVGDYKTSTSLESRVNVTDMLKGRTLQVPLYQLLAGEGSSVELLGIHPELDDEDTHVAFAGFEPGDQAESFRDTLRVLLALRARGSFPFNDGHHCKWCPYTSACRRTHPPSVERNQHRSDGAAYRGLGRKSKRNPWLKTD